MQNGSVIRRVRKKHSNIWQVRWWETTAEGNQIYRRREELAYSRYIFSMALIGGKRPSFPFWRRSALRVKIGTWPIVWK
jgi:hypothetical protein